MKKMYQKGSQQGMAHSTWVAVEGTVSIKREPPQKLWPPRPEAQGWAAVERGGPVPGPWLHVEDTLPAVAQRGESLGWTPAWSDLPASASRFLPRPRVGQIQQEAPGQVMPGRSEVPGLGLKHGCRWGPLWRLRLRVLGALSWACNLAQLQSCCGPGEVMCMWWS